MLTRPTLQGPREADGFTLVEMMVVITIMAMLAAIVVPSYRLMERHSQRNTCAANLKSIGQALTMFREEYQCYPPDATEFLWTEEAVQNYRSRYGADPPGDHRLGSPFGAAYYSPEDSDPNLRNKAIDTGVHGLGLYTLYYVGAYSSVLPPSTLEPRFYYYDSVAERWLLLRELDASKGLNQKELDWFKGSGYITRLDTFHCPANAAVRQDDWLRWRQSPDRVGVPYLGGWGNYDVFYRRNFWHPGTKETWVVDQITPSGRLENRNLLQPYPPVDTIITWCPHHRSAKAPSGPGELAEVNPGDEDLVLFADGSVRRMVASKTNRPFEDPSADFGYPQGPIM